VVDVGNKTKHKTICPGGAGVSFIGDKKRALRELKKGERMGAREKKKIKGRGTEVGGVATGGKYSLSGGGLASCSPWRKVSIWGTPADA